MDSAPTNAPRELVLLVDDDPGVLRLLTRGLSNQSRSVLACETPGAARKALEGNSFTGAIFDLYFEDKPAGIDLLRATRANPGTESLPIVAMSGRSTAAIERCLSLGADAILSKPFLAHEAAAVLDRAADNRRLAGVLRGASILHIEDCDDWADLMRRWLAEVGASARRVRDRAGLMTETARGAPPPDAIVLDLTLDGVDGLELLAALKDSPSLQSVPVIVLSARESSRPRALRGRALAFIEKGPNTREDLIPVLASVCDQHRRSRGYITSAELVFDPASGSVRYKGRLAATLDGRPLTLFALLARRGVNGATEAELFAAGQRRAGRTESHRSVANYVSELRQILGPELGALIRSLPNNRYALTLPGVPF